MRKVSFAMETKFHIWWKPPFPVPWVSLYVLKQDLKVKNKKSEEPYYSGSRAKHCNMRLCSRKWRDLAQRMIRNEIAQIGGMTFQTSDLIRRVRTLHLKFYTLKTAPCFPYRTLLWLFCIAYNTKMRKEKKAAFYWIHENQKKNLYSFKWSVSKHRVQCFSL